MLQAHGGEVAHVRFGVTERRGQEIACPWKSKVRDRTDRFATDRFVHIAQGTRQRGPSCIGVRKPSLQARHCFHPHQWIWVVLDERYEFVARGCSLSAA